MKTKPVPYLANLPLELTIPLDPEAEAARAAEPPNLESPAFWAEFMKRTRRYQQLTRAPAAPLYARGMDSKPSELA